MAAKNNEELPFGSLAVCSTGSLISADANSFPEYMIASASHINKPNNTVCFPVTENMIFLVEFVGTVKPQIGMKVGIKDFDGIPASSVSFSSSGKGVILSFSDKENLVYVKFNNK